MNCASRPKISTLSLYRRKGRCLTGCIAVLALLSGLVSCAGLKARADGAFPLYGMIYDDRGRGVADAMLELSDNLVTYSDFNGRFVFTNILPGDYSLKAAAPGLEKLEQTISVSDSGSVLYLHMVSVEGLYAGFLGALQAGQWQTAGVTLQRALAIDPEAYVLRYAEAALLYTALRPDRDWQRAEALLLSLLADGVHESAVYLMLADIAQYDKADAVAAAGYLETCLKLEFSADVSARLAGLNAAVSTSVDDE